jgi:outer membrane immunogenic protein
MRNHVLAGAMSLAFASAVAVGSAFAADVPEPVPVPGSAPVINWQGFHIGVQGGYGWAPADAEFASGSSGARDFDLAGWLGGGQVGFDLQTSSGLVVGIEADGSWANLSDSFFGPGAVVNTMTTIEQSIDTFYTARLRVGQAMGRWLPYITGGAAFATATRSQNTTGNIVFQGEDTASYTGWTVGAGAEYAINDHLSVRGQYLYADLGTQNFDLPAPGGDGVDVSLKASIASVGLNVRF